MMMIKTLEVCSLMPESNDSWFMRRMTNRDYTIKHRNTPCSECGSLQYVHTTFEDYCLKIIAIIKEGDDNNVTY